MINMKTLSTNILRLFNKLSGMLIVIAAITVTPDSFAHSRWIISSHTILSGDDAPFISLDFSISNDIFHADVSYGGKPLIEQTHDTAESVGTKDPKQAVRQKLMQRMFSSTRLRATFPDGSTDDSLPIVNLGRKSASAIQLQRPGTYRFNVIQNPVDITLYQHADGTPGREFGLLKDTKSLLPEGAGNIKTLRIHNRVETYVTRNDLTAKSLEATGDGLELIMLTHPNELFAGETASFKLSLNGKPPGETVTIKLTRNDTRYRNERNTLEITTKKTGEFEIPWQQAGLYLLEAEVEVKAKNKVFDSEVFSLYATLEVNPE